MLTSITHSLLVSFLATAVAFFAVLPLAYLGAFRRYWGKAIVETILFMPLVLPPTVVGLYVLKAFGRYGSLGKLTGLFNYSVIFSLSGAVIAATIIVLPIMYQGLKAAFAGVAQDLLDDASMLTDKPLLLLRYVILPVAYPLILSTLLLSFCRALGEFGASLMVAGFIPGKTDTIANSIYFAILGGDNRTAYLLSLMNVVFGLLVIGLIRLLGRKEKL